MLSDKGTNIFSEIGKFFKENDATRDLWDRSLIPQKRRSTDPCHTFNKGALQMQGTFFD